MEIINGFKGKKRALMVIVPLYCAVIASVVTFVMTTIYNPGQNTVEALASVYMDIVSIIIILILMVDIVFDTKISNRTTHIFTYMLIATVWALFLDFLNWAFDGSLQFGHLTFWFTVGSLCMGSVLACILLLYLNSFMYETHDFDVNKKALICATFNIISFFLTLFLAFSGTAFEFVDGHYKVGALYDIVTMIPVATVLFFVGLVIVNVRKVGIHDCIAVVGYILFMVTGALIESEAGFGATYVAIAIADIFIFVMLQNQIIVHEKQNARQWMLESTTDSLTGLFNRRAYDMDIDEIETKTAGDDFVYVSVDVNSLKKVNDSLGHKAGDELIIGAAGCLKDCFGAYGKIYRIGGDEFTALLNVDEQKLDELKDCIKELTGKWRGKNNLTLSLSCGYALKSEGHDMKVKQMALIADSRMYEEKKKYYSFSENERRGNL